MKASAVQVEGDLTVVRGTKFKVSFAMVDSISNLVIPYPNYRVSIRLNYKIINLKNQYLSTRTKI
jgi:hypothetical protein